MLFLRTTAEYLTVLHTEAVRDLPDNDPAKLAFSSSLSNLLDTTLSRNLRNALEVVAGQTNDRETQPEDNSGLIEICDAIGAKEPLQLIAIASVFQNREAFGLQDIGLQEIQRAVQLFDLPTTLRNFWKQRPDFYSPQGKNPNALNNAMAEIDRSMTSIPDERICSLMKIAFANLLILDACQSIVEHSPYIFTITKDKFYNPQESLPGYIIADAAQNLPQPHKTNFWKTLTACQTTILQTAQQMMQSERNRTIQAIAKNCNKKY